MFKSVRVTRASTEIIDQVQEAIFTRQLAPGDRLPSERELAEQFGVSRITVRDALRSLEAFGLVRIRVGANGGTFVAEASSSVVINSLATMLRLQRVSLRDLTEARIAIEGMVVELAARRATEADYAAMRQANEDTLAALAVGAPYAEHSLAFHQALAAAAKNQVLLFTVTTYRHLIREALHLLAASRPEWPRRALRDHQLLYEALVARDGSRARGLVEEHLGFYANLVDELEPAEDGAVVTARAALVGGAAVVDLHPSGGPAGE